MSKAQTKIIVVHETVLHSLAKDAVTFGMLVAVVGIGWLLDIFALQWIGGTAWIIWILASAKGYRDPTTIDEARKHLDKLERDFAEARK